MAFVSLAVSQGWPKVICIQEDGPTVSKAKTKRPRKRILVGIFAGLIILGGLFASLFLGRWANWIEVVPSEVEQVFAAALLEAGDGPPYIEMAENGEVIVHHEQEAAHPDGFKQLIVLLWSPGDDQVLRVEYPRWFVWMKTSSFVNLGTMIAAIRKDWDNFDLSISYKDLHRRGAGLLLDHQAEDGARILLWTSPKGRTLSP